MQQFDGADMTRLFQLWDDMRIRSKIIATMVNYACHPVSLGGGNKMISPDYYGAMREVSDALGVVTAATDWAGMSINDLGTVIALGLIFAPFTMRTAIER